MKNSEKPLHMTDCFEELFDKALEINHTSRASNQERNNRNGENTSKSYPMEDVLLT